jgi:hypothetical protein
MSMYRVPNYGRYCLITWGLAAGILSFIGNLTLLTSSLVTNTLKLDKVSVVLIQNLAITGLGFTVFIILPTVGSTVAQSWIYGEELCHVTAYILYLLGFLTTYLIASLNISKLTVLLFPLRATVSTTFLTQNTEIYNSVKHQKWVWSKRPYAVEFKICT